MKRHFKILAIAGALMAISFFCFTGHGNEIVSNSFDELRKEYGFIDQYSPTIQGDTIPVGGSNIAIGCEALMIQTGGNNIAIGVKDFQK